MAQVSSFVNTARARVSAFLKAKEDMEALQREFNADGGVTFTNTFDFSAENSSTYDMTQAEFNSMLTVIGEFITFVQGGSAPVRATREADFYKGKV